MSSPSTRLADSVRDGEPRAVARGISLVEEDSPGADDLLRAIFPHTGRAQVIGLTGPPGAGKSSLVDRLVAAYRARGNRVGVVAVDPSSAYTGGAILGDRVRMQAHATDPGVFIRSMATRGFLGGLARTTNDAIDLLDAAGYDPILVETVGVGQDEVDVIKTADLVAVILMPGMGDDIQAIKAGILEIADLFVINKADRPGADRLATELQYMLSLAASDNPTPAILQTVATQDQGIREMVDAFAELLERAKGRGRGARRRQRAEGRFMALLGERLLARVRRDALPDERLEEIVERIAARELDPYSAVERILERLEVR